MKLLDVSTENCPIDLTLNVVGTTWTLRILREAFFGARRFTDFQSRLGVSSARLAERLDLLVDHHILTRGSDAANLNGRGGRREYRLTAKGRDLYPVLTALRQWGEAYALDESSPPVDVSHLGCGASVGVELRCADGHRVTIREVVATPGLGARPR